MLFRWRFLTGMLADYLPVVIPATGRQPCALRLDYSGGAVFENDLEKFVGAQDCTPLLPWHVACFGTVVLAAHLLPCPIW